jgi:hypothetical protein
MFVTPDEFNEVFIEFGVAKAWDYSYTAPGAGDDTPSINYFSLRTDLGAFLGLPIGLVATGGVDSLYTNKYEVTGTSYERTLIRSDIDPVPWKLEFDGGMWQLTFAIGWGQTIAGTEPKGIYNDLGLYLFLPEVLMGEWEFFYIAEDDPGWLGNLGVSYSSDQMLGGRLGVAGGFAYNLAENEYANVASDPDWADPADAADWLLGKFPYQWAYGLGAAWVQGGLDTGIAINGWDESELFLLGIDLDYMITEAFGAGGATAFNFSDAAEAGDYTWMGFDIYGKIVAAGAEWKVGYLYRNNDSGWSYSWVPPAFYGAAAASAPEGGLYFIADVDF